MASRRRTRRRDPNYASPAQPSEVEGTIVTFYSYKGGTGRSMALANVAWLLACAGRRVLVIDWDLEAPGLHRFFAPFLEDPQLKDTQGLIEFMLNFAVEAATPVRSAAETTTMGATSAPPGEAGATPWFEPFANIVPYARPLKYSFPMGGSLDFVPAGQQGASYAAKVGAFDWGGFYDRMGGGVFLEAVKRRVRRDYHYVLIDSRTGVSDSSGICTVQMPDTLIVCFTASNQSIEGGAGVARSVLSQWVAAPSRQRPPRILPVFTRVDDFESAKLYRRQLLARRAFDQVLEPTITIPSDRIRYWRETEVPYKPFYCYEEILASFADEPGKPNSLLAAMERLTGQITEGEVIELSEPPSASTRLGILALYEGQSDPSPLGKEAGANAYDVYVSYSSPDRPVVEALVRKLRIQELNVWFDTSNLRPGDNWEVAIEEAWKRSATAVVCIGPGGIGKWQQRDIEALTERLQYDGETFRIIPVLLPGAEYGRLPPPLNSIQSARFRETIDEDATFRSLIDGIRRGGPGPTPAEGVAPGENPYRGLEPFTEADQPFFFGRDAELKAVIDRLRRMSTGRAMTGLTTIVGPSGSGKTSLVNAGLIPALRGNALTGSADWPIILARPGAHPLENLAFAVLAERSTSTYPGPAAELEDAMENDGDTLRAALTEITSGNPTARCVLVLIDQFEEVFTVCSDERHRAAFIGNLSHAVKSKSGRFIVVLVSRNDSLDQWQNYPELALALGEDSRLVEVGPLHGESLYAAIARPAQMLGCEVEPGLAELLTDESEGQPAALPFLQLVLSELWRRRDGRRLTVSAYRQLGGLQGMLAQRANEVLGQLGRVQQDACRMICLRLVRPGEDGSFLRRRVPFAELVPAGNSRISSAQISAVVERLTDARLLKTSASSGGETSVEIAHDALIAGWSALRGWLDEDLDGLRTQHALADAASRWVDHGRHPDFLLFGQRLAEFDGWTEGHRDQLNRLETDFLAESRARHQALRPYLELLLVGKRLSITPRTVLALAASVLLLGLITSGLAPWLLEHARYTRTASELTEVKGKAVSAEESLKAVTESSRAKVAGIEQDLQQAQRMTGLLKVRLLASESATALEKKDRALAVLLAVEALNASGVGPRADVAEQALRDALGDFGSRGLAAGDSSGRSPLDMSRDGRRLATATGLVDKSNSGPSRVQVWDLTLENPAASPRYLEGFKDGVATLSLAPDGRFLVSGDPHGAVNFWDLGPSSPIPQPLGNLPTGLRATAVNSDFLLIAVANSGAVKMWNSLDRKAPPTGVPSPSDAVSSAVINPARHLVAVGTRDGKAYMTFVAATPVPWALIMGDAGEPVTHMAVSAPGRWLITAGERSARLWDLSGSNPAATWVPLGGQRGTVTAVSLSDDERCAVVVESDGRAQIWALNGSAPSPAPVVLTAPTRAVADACFSHDARRLALAGDSLIPLWELPAGDQRSSAVVLRGGAGHVFRLAFSVDARWLVSAGDEYRLWPLRLDDLRELARLAAGRNLSAQEWDRYFPDQPYRKTFPTLPGPAEQVAN